MLLQIESSLHPPFLILFFFYAEFLTEPGAYQLGSTGWPVSTRDPLVSVHVSSAVLDMCAAMPGMFIFFHGYWRPKLKDSCF